MAKPRIIGEGKIPEAEAFRDVQAAFDGWDDLVLCAHVALPLGLPIPEGSVIYNMEPLYEGCRSFSVGYENVLARFPVLDYQRKNVEYLASLGIEATHVPYGWHPALERVTPVAHQDIDVLFVGSLNARRAPILDALSRAGLAFVSAQGFYGKALDQLVARAKVCVNIHFRDEHPLEVARLNYLMANGCAIVSEPGWDAEDNARYSDGLWFSAYEDLVENCAGLVANPALRGQLGAEAIRTIRGIRTPAREEVMAHA